MTGTQRAWSREGTLASVDRRGSALARRAADYRPVGRVAVALSHLGRGGILWSTLGLAIGPGRRPLTRAAASTLSVAAIASAVAGSTALAHVFGRQRPCGHGLASLVPCPEGGSFPSDQAAAAFAGAEVLSWLTPAAAGWLRGSATALAVARVAAGVHYPSDVLAGAVFGTAIGRAARSVGQRRATADEAPPPRE